MFVTVYICVCVCVSMCGCTTMIITLAHLTLPPPPVIDVRCLDHPAEGGLGAWPQLGEAFPVVPGANQEEGLPRSSKRLQWLQLRAGNVQEPGSKASEAQLTHRSRNSGMADPVSHLR